jgi:LytR cell envelope-related transcriptional attenuator
MSNEDPSTSGQGSGRRSPRQGIGGSPVGSTLSIVLAVVAVVAGFLILRNITDDDGASSTPGDGAETDDTSTTLNLGLTPTTIPVTSTTVPALVTQGATVLVANASGVPGSAGRMSTALATVGFTMAEEPTNATTQLDVSVVYYDPAVAAAQAVAGSVATSMGGLEVVSVPTPVPVEGGSLNSSGVLVMLGKAQADKTLEELSAASGAPPTGSAPAVAGTESSVPTATTG